MNNKSQKTTVSNMKELETLMYIPLTLALIEMRHWNEEECEQENNRQQVEDTHNK